MGDDSRPDISYDYPESLARSPEPPAGIRKMADVYVTMRDGVKLCVDIYLPQDDGPYPALLSLSPYLKDLQHKPPHWSHAIESGATTFFVPKGYIHVIAQGRGGGLSQGKWQWFDEKERTDGYDLIEWIAAQPWCAGDVGMIGDSYWSWSQYAAAQAQPPHLRCICQCDSSIDFYRDVVYQGGIYHHAFISNWVEYHTRQFAWPGEVDGKEEPMNLTYEAARHPTDGPWWRERSPVSGLDRIHTPSLHIAMQGGVTHIRGQLRGYTQIQAPKRLLVCPAPGFWSHVRYLTSPGLNRQMLRWFDHWLKGIDTGIMEEPEVAIFDSATRGWRYEAEYPLARTDWVSFYLGVDGALGQSAPTGDEPADSYRMPDSFAQIVGGKPVLAYATPPLDHAMRIAGPISFTLHAASSQPDTVWYAYLVDVAPDGKAAPVSSGKLKASFRALDAARSRPGQPYHLFEAQELLEPGRIYHYEIEMMPAFRTIAQGHRLELRIASEDIAYNNPLRQIDLHLLPWPVENTIHHSKAHPSNLLLPVIPDAPEIAPVQPPVSEIDWPLLPGSWSPNTDGWPLVGD
ncbi:MAG: CocE/NonD family hydrolase [Rhodospirillales bacterium]|nr:CocE/NonD family hydrolase [Rhodospirillales bacterium]